MGELKMSKQNLKRIYPVLDVFRQDILQTGCPTPHDALSFVDMYPHYTQPDVQLLIMLGNSRGWPSPLFMNRMIDTYKPNAADKSGGITSAAYYIE